jgi:hypothetical protein
MSCTLGLWVGESFAEVSIFSTRRDTTCGSMTSKDDQIEVKSRWFLPRKTLADGLRDALSKMPEAAAKGGEVRIATSRVESTLNRRQGSTTAFLTTAGFENWLTLDRTSIAPFTSGSLKDPKNHQLVSDDLVFGLNERTNAKRELVAPVSLQELELLADKLTLAKVRAVAIGFLNSTLNPENELRASHFLRERGFFVTCSHQFRGCDERSRWQRTIECAYAEQAANEELQQIRSALESFAPVENWSLIGWGKDGATTIGQADFARHFKGGVEASLAASAGQSSVLHFGLEGFHLSHAVKAPQAAALALEPQSEPQSQPQSELRAALHLELQPTRQIQAASWAVPALGHEDRGYEPGPMLLGKSHHLAAIDILYIRDRLNFDIEGFSDRITERSRTRILESLFTLGKAMPTQGNSPLQATDIAEDIERAFVERIAIELAESLATTSIASRTDKMSPASVTLSGALAPAFANSLARRRPDLKFSLSKDAAWALSAATLSTTSLGTSLPVKQDPVKQSAVKRGQS